MGFRYPATAGSASGVLQAPPGYNRVYVYAPEGLSVRSFYSALKAGRTFATNGPMLTLDVDGKMFGDTVEVVSSQPLRLTAEAQAREPVDRTEIIANGHVIADATAGSLEAEGVPKNYTWLAVRCTLANESTIRLAHTSPVFLRGGKQSWNSTEDKAFFLKWIDDLVAGSNADPMRFADVNQKNEILAIYKSARLSYLS